MDNHFRVRIKKNDFEIEVESTEKDYVDSKVNEFYGDLTKHSPSLPVKTNQDGNGKQNLLPTTITPKETSLQEFVKRVKPNSGPEKAVTIGYFVEKIQNKGLFYIQEIKEGFSKIKFPHSNPSDTVSKAKASGKIMEGSEKGSYILTQTGESWVEERLSQNENAN